MTDCDLNIVGDISLGWSLSTITFSEVEHVIEEKYGLYWERYAFDLFLSITQ